MATDGESSQVVLAFFDVLGFADRVAAGEVELLYEKYRVLTESLARVRRATYSHWVPRQFSEYAQKSDGLRELLANRRPVEWVPAATIHDADDFLSLHFSDTMMFWADDHFFGNGEFVDVAIDFFCRSLEADVPLRGAIATGDLIYDANRSIILGSALVEAAKAESAQAWCGLGLGPSLRGRTIMAPNDRVLKFEDHIKSGRESDVLNTAVDWTWHWRARNPEVSLESVARRFRDHEYWQPTLKFAARSMELDHLGHLPIHDLEV